MTARFRLDCITDGEDLVPSYAHDTDAGADVRITEDVTLRPMESALVGTGLRIDVPNGVVCYMHPRSGLATKQGITLINATGVIDAGYHGEVRVPLINLSGTTKTIERGTRVAQLVFHEFMHANFTRVSSFGESERGEGGFGSTGTE